MADLHKSFCIESVSKNDTCLSVSWADGHSSRFHPIWLRHQCNCPQCGTPVNAVRGIRLHHLEESPTFSIETQQQDHIILHWTDEHHHSRYESKWLRQYCYDEPSRQQRRHQPLLWDASIIDHLPTMDLVECESSDAQRLEMLKTVHDYGFCKVNNAPTDAKQATRLINIVGQQRQSHYGTYTLSNKEAVDNVGDISDALDPHVDETYRLSTIGITVFQVLRPSQKGGESTLVDGFEAARQLRELFPDDFNLLTRVPITGCRRDPAQNSAGNVKWYESTLPIIRVDFDGIVTGVRCNERQIMPLDLPFDLIEPTYRALKLFYQILYQPNLQITLALKAGEGLIFDNQRLLHGRTAFTPETPARSVLTSSVDLEEFHSAYRLLHEQIHGEPLPFRLRQGMMA